VTRAPVEFSVAQIRQPLYVTLSDGRIQNHYTLKLNNKTSHRARYTLEVQGINADWEALPNKHLVIMPEQSLSVDVLVRMPATTTSVTQQEFSFVIIGQEQMQGVLLEQQTGFFWPKVD
jgi:polyferredoxin